MIKAQHDINRQLRVLNYAKKVIWENMVPDFWLIEKIIYEKVLLTDD